jgi:hypothetical protein|nr:MAG TPA_asm: PD-(D/E)XK endonuclease [Caudoviricetes sp.]
MNSKDKGNMTEAKALYEFIKRGIPVYRPFGDNTRCDMIIDVNNNLYRIQAKTSNMESHGSIMGYTRSSKNHTTNKRLDTYVGQVDYFVFYSQSRDKIALVPMGVIGEQKSINLRLDPPKNNQKNVHYFDDFSIDNVLCVETLHEEPKS